MLSIFKTILATTFISISAHGAGVKEEIKIGLSQEFDSLHPMVASMLAANYTFSLAGRSLIVLDEKGNWVTQLAKEIPSFQNGLATKVVEAGQKSVKATWEIIEKAKWSDGKPVVCADFALALKVANSDTVAVASKEDYVLIKSVTWDPKTPKKCIFTSNGERWDFYQIPRFIPLPAHVEGPIFEKFAAEKGGYEKNSLYSKNPTAAGLYNGPYKVAEVKPGSHVTFEINPYFYGTKPQFKKVHVMVYPDTNSLEANFLTGSIDVISPIGIGFDQALRLEKKIQTEKLPYQIQFQPALTYEHIDVNFDNPILKDIRVRAALMYALNREELVQAMFEGKQKVAHHYMAPVDPWYEKDLKKIRVYTYNKAHAEKLLDKAGWVKNNEDGYRYKDGQKLSLQLMTTAGNKVREMTEVFLQKQWKEVGIEITIKNEAPRVFFGETVKKRKFPALAMYAWGAFPEKTPTQFHSNSIPSDKNGWSGRNTMGWSNKKADVIIELIENELDPAKRALLAQSLQKIYSEDLPTLSLFYRADVALAPIKLKNYQITGHQFSETNQIENWTWQ